MLGRVRRSPRLRRLAAALGAWYIRLVDRTTAWEIPDPALRDRIRAQQERIVIAIWHGRLLIIPAEMPPGGRVHAMISANRDGDIIADCVGRFGIASMRGSSRDPRKPLKRKGGAAAAAEAIELLGEYDRIAVALTPDGPRGPRMPLFRRPWTCRWRPSPSRPPGALSPAAGIRSSSPCRSGAVLRSGAR